MSGNADTPQGPDLRRGVPSRQLSEGGTVLGHVDGDAVLLVRLGGSAYGLGASCTHWGGPLAEGLVAGGCIRCPWHHARFDVRSGEVAGGPALDGIARWATEERDGVVRVRGRLEDGAGRALDRPHGAGPETIVIVGAGAAGAVAAGELRRAGYERTLILIDPDPDASVDRPNLSKAFLAGTAPEEWIPLRPEQWWADRQIERRRSAVRRLDASARELTLANGAGVRYDALILATGSEPVRLGLPGEGPPLHTLRTLADARRLVAAASQGDRAVVLGASFIGLEVAASLRERNLEVHVVAPEARPLERVMGREVGDFVRGLHEDRGVQFHLGQTARRLVAGGLELTDGTLLRADFAVMGVGVRPRVDLAVQAGLAVDDGVVVNEHLESSVPGIFAVGDIARYPEPHSGGTLRVEHWVVAQRQARTAARNVLGFGEVFRDAPFFWSQHYDVPIAYVGHAPAWDAVEVDGSFADRDVAVRYRKDGRALALATVGRDDASLAFEAELEAAT